MIKQMNIALICDSRIALPLMQKLHEEGVLCAVAVTDRKPDILQLYRQQTAVINAPLTIFEKASFEHRLQEWLIDVNPDAVMVLTFPWRIRTSALAIPEHGFINFHFGLLPQMRGADPMFECIRRRITETGVTIHKMDAGWDTGDIIMQQKIQLVPGTTYGMLGTQLAFVGASMAEQLIKKLKNGIAVEATEQDERQANYWPKIEERELHINWETMDATTITALVNACNSLVKGNPCVINGWTVGLCDVTEINLSGDASHIAPGTIIAIDAQNGLLVCTKDGKALKLEIIYTEEGLFPGYKLAAFGIITGMRFTPSYNNHTLQLKT